MLELLELELKRAIKLSNIFAAENNPVGATNMAHYADGVRFAISKIKRSLDVPPTNTI